MEAKCLHGFNQGRHIKAYKSKPAQQAIHSSTLTWKLREAPFKTTILYTGPSMGFHVNLGEAGGAPGSCVIPYQAPEKGASVS